MNKKQTKTKPLAKLALGDIEYKYILHRIFNNMIHKSSH